MFIGTILFCISAIIVAFMLFAVMIAIIDAERSESNPPFFRLHALIYKRGNVLF